LGRLGEEGAEGGQQFEVDGGGGAEGVDVEETGLGDEGEREGEFGEVERGAVRGLEMEVLEIEGGVLEGWRIGGGEVELGEGVVEGEFEMGGGGVALELKLEVVEMDGFDLEARESGGAGSGGWFGGGSQQGEEAGKAGGGGGEVEAVEGDLTEGGAVGEEGFPVGEGGGTEGGEG
jgi:hypothetical protein